VVAIAKNDNRRRHRDGVEQRAALRDRNNAIAVAMKDENGTGARSQPKFNGRKSIAGERARSDSSGDPRSSDRASGNPDSRINASGLRTIAA
jgi:hypothetical protein